MKPVVGLGFQVTRATTLHVLSSLAKPQWVAIEWDSILLKCPQHPTTQLAPQQVFS